MKRVDPISLHPTAESFEADVLGCDKPVIVDFWAPWCPPCLMLKPEMERLGVDLAGRAKVAFVNVDEEPDLAGMFGVSSIPAVMVFKNGRRVDGWTGFAPRGAMLARVGRHIPE